MLIEWDGEVVVAMGMSRYEGCAVSRVICTWRGSMSDGPRSLVLGLT